MKQHSSNFIYGTIASGRSFLWAICALALLLLAGCGGNPSTGEEDGLITVDVTKSYPEKEFVLQDLFDIEYVPLETTEEFLTTRWVLDISSHYILTMNLREGELFLFDRATGKGVKKICRRGEGPEEYLHAANAVIDEERNEIFVDDGMRRRFLVYDLEGNFKRSFKTIDHSVIMNVRNFNQKYLLCQDDYKIGNMNSKLTFFLISKENGQRKGIEIPYSNRISNWVWKIVSEDFVYSNNTDNCQIIPYGTKWYLMEPSADTVYALQKDLSLKPFLVREPSVQGMDPVVFLFPCMLTKDYCFMQSVEKFWDFDANEGFPRKDLVYDKREGKIYECVLQNADYEGQELNLLVKAFTQEVAFQFGLDPADLIEAHAAGQLSGRLQEIASTLDEEDNPVILIAKYKK